MTPARAHLREPGQKGRAWVPRTASPGSRRPRPNKFLGRSLLRPLGVLCVLRVDSALHVQCRWPPPRLGPPPPRRWCGPRASARSQPDSPRSQWGRVLRPGPGPPSCTPLDASVIRPTPSPRLSSPSPGRPPPRRHHRHTFGHSRLRARTPAWAHAAHARNCPPLARTHRVRSTWLRTRPPLAASTRCPLRRPGPGTHGATARRARRAPARRARSRGP